MTGKKLTDEEGKQCVKRDMHMGSPPSTQAIKNKKNRS